MARTADSENVQLGSGWRVQLDLVRLVLQESD
jgi:hypothetical protein